MKFEVACPCCTSRRSFLRGVSALAATAVVPVAKAEAGCLSSIIRHHFAFAGTTTVSSNKPAQISEVSV
jgi:hypothetical protein